MKKLLGTLFAFLTLIGGGIFASKHIDTNKSAPVTSVTVPITPSISVVKKEESTKNKETESKDKENKENKEDNRKNDERKGEITNLLGLDALTTPSVSPPIITIPASTPVIVPQDPPITSKADKELKEIKNDNFIIPTPSTITKRTVKTVKNWFTPSSDRHNSYWADRVLDEYRKGPGSHRHVFDSNN